MAMCSTSCTKASSFCFIKTILIVLKKCLQDNLIISANFWMLLMDNALLVHRLIVSVDEDSF